MSASVASEILSDHIVHRMKGRRLVSAVFMTFQFDAGFFEQEVLPVLLDIPLSHAKPIRLVQLDAALMHVPGQVAVYYDANGIVTSDAGSPKLDIRRIPVRHATGVFHPKNAFLLVEDAEAGDDGTRARSLIVASMSANLTRSGWWENIEVCHVEEIAAGARTRLGEDLIAFLDSTKARARAETEHLSLRLIREFLRNTEPRANKSTDERLHPHFYSGKEPLADFLDTIGGSKLRGTYLEVISPFFDGGSNCGPLRELITRFEPKETRVFLPRAPTGEALCDKGIYDDVRSIPNVSWGKLDLPKEFFRLGRTEDARERYVHAKVYRFYTQNPKREIWFVGSANLTSAAHNNGGNVESGFLVEVIPEKRPEPWLLKDDRKPVAFKGRSETDSIAASGGTRLNLRFSWDTPAPSGHAFWDAPGESPVLRLEGHGGSLGEIGPLPPREWVDLSPALANALHELLPASSLVHVHGDGPTPGVLLIQEEGLSHKPSIILHLSAADILRYWALLTPAQQSAFIEARAPELSALGAGADLVTSTKLAVEHDTLFDRFAGVFHAFGCLERSVREALEADNAKQATYRLFGKKHDSLGNLLTRVLSEDDKADAVDQYVIVMCAQQLCKEISRDFTAYWHERRADARELEERFAAAATIRERLVRTDPDTMPAFLEWFDRRFLSRAKRAEATP